MTDEHTEIEEIMDDEEIGTDIDVLFKRIRPNLDDVIPYIADIVREHGAGNDEYDDENSNVYFCVGLNERRADKYMDAYNKLSIGLFESGSGSLKPGSLHPNDGVYGIWAVADELDCTDITPRTYWALVVRVFEHVIHVLRTSEVIGNDGFSITQHVGHEGCYLVKRN